MASTSFNKTQRKSSKDTPTNKSIWFAKDYDHEDSKFGEIILEEDKEEHNQEHDKLSVEDQQIEENNERKPRSLFALRHSSIILTIWSPSLILAINPSPWSLAVFGSATTMAVNVTTTRLQEFLVSSECRGGT
ncbi:hypothetical protein Tco_0465786 [Tanacetum coccineum]